MGEQRIAPEQPKPNYPLNIGARIKASFITLLAPLWTFIVGIWTILILGIFVGIAGNASFALLSTGQLSLTGTITVFTWLLAHLTFIVTLLTLFMVITICSFLAHYRKQQVVQQAARDQQYVREKSFVDIAARVTDIGEGIKDIATGVKQSLDELKMISTPNHASSSPKSGNQIGTLSSTVWNIPYRRNPYFTGREQILQILHDRLVTRKVAGITPLQVISGLGGIGKTQIAVEYAYRHYDKYRYFLWVNAYSRETIIASFIQLAQQLELSEKRAQDQNKIVDDIKNWLTMHDQWLLIFDNADDLALADEYIPVKLSGHLLLTTRHQQPGAFPDSLYIDKMGKEEGVLLVLRRANMLTKDACPEQTKPEYQAQAERIVAVMDGLPLALDQAAAYIQETSCSLNDYLERYKYEQTDLLRRRGVTNKDHPLPVATTWSLSFAKVQQMNATAADLLRVFAFLAPDAIPEEIFITGASELGPHLEGVKDHPKRLDEAVAVLRRFSLISRNWEEHIISIHQLVQAVLLIDMDEQSRETWAERCTQAVNKAFPNVVFSTWLQCERLLPHALRCATLIDTYALNTSEAARLLNQTAIYLQVRAQNSEAELLYRQAIRIDEHFPNHEHPDLAAHLNNLADLCRVRGKYTEAELLYQRAISIRERVLGPEHPDTATSLNDLAYVYHAIGQFEKAEALYQRALIISERVLGFEHPDTATSLDNLASIYQVMGQFEKAEPLYLRALAIREHVLDPDHPWIATSLDNLASLYQTMGQFEKAEPLYLRALAIREHKLGSDHPRTAVTLNGLALLYYDQGKYKQAEPLLLRALSIQEHTLDAAHPDVARTLTNLMLLYQAQGNI